MLYYKRPSAVSTAGDSNVIANLQNTITVAQVNKNKQDFSQHPAPCQKYLQFGKDVSPPPQTTPQMKIKSSGTDDGFKGEAAKCGSSIIRVASQMVSGKVIHGFTLSENNNCDGSQPLEKYDGQKRRGSKSLPASPLTSPHSSPKSNRKVINKYFTGAFTDVDRSKGGWILSNLLAKREMSASVDRIVESKEELERSSSTASIDDVGLKKSPVFKAKPSELREMNFWSPTSM
ncbi:uncharacterized protein isoform X2 [Leptinotarsa decemlineata]|nr:uncharacterized protein LOC111506545 isoform X2 [Leptinotarsa decemlineata]XP_023017421.1 uncharacterized protein LOC111506545 isoform X2 [Leptinotarsa decemlineata]